MARVVGLLRQRWSAEQISGTLRKTGELRISTETIYRRIRCHKKTGGTPFGPGPTVAVMAR